MALGKRIHIVIAVIAVIIALIFTSCGADSTETTQQENGTSQTEQSEEVTEASDTADASDTKEGAPFALHGILSVKGTDLVDADGNKYQLRGVSTHVYMPVSLNTLHGEFEQPCR